MKQSSWLVECRDGVTAMAWEGVPMGGCLDGRGFIAWPGGAGRQGAWGQKRD